MTRHQRTNGQVREVFWAFLVLGMTSFGGPVAHLGYFRHAFVERRQWLSEQAYADLIAICQFLPGPTSSQVGFALGLVRAGPWGAAMAWLAFTLPSAVALILFALGAAALDGAVANGIIHGLKLVAVAIVGHALWGMARHLCPDKTRAGIALGAMWVAVIATGPMGQVVAIVLGGFAGLMLCRRDFTMESVALHSVVSCRTGAVALAVFFSFLMLAPLLMGGSVYLDVWYAFYRAGAMVFGGGHVVLPLLETEFVQPGWVTPDEFLAGYGAAQAVPGPLFTFAAYLGALLPVGNVWGGALMALVAIFMPGFLLLVGVLPFWSQLQHWRSAQAVMRGTNAAVVGILGAAFYQPVWVSAVLGPQEFALALAGFLLLAVWKTPAWLVVMILAVGGAILALHSG